MKTFNDHNRLFLASKMNWFCSCIYNIVTFISAIIMIMSSGIWMPIYIFVYSFNKTIKLIKSLIRLPLAIARISWQHQNPQICYAIIKGNGKYLQNNNQHVFIHQLYDYSVRKFMSVPDLQSDMSILQIQTDSMIGLIYLSQTYPQINITTLNSHEQQVTKNIQQCKKTDIKCLQSQYLLNQNQQKYNIIIMFHIRSKIITKQLQNIDLLEFLSYINHHIQHNGLIIIGEYLQLGEHRVLQQLFSIYGLIIVDYEDITKNILHGNKIMRHNHPQWQNQVAEIVIDRLNNLFEFNQHNIQKMYRLYLLTIQ